MQTINLIEWETRMPAKNSPLAGPVLANDPSAQRLAQMLTNDGRIEILELARGLELRATSYVGRFNLGTLLITIKPKLSGLPLMNLLRYAYRLRNLQLFDEVDYAASQAGFEDLLIHQLAAETSELLLRGLHRDYLRMESCLDSPRGRIDFGAYSHVATTGGVALPCIHHPRSEDTALNQVLYGGLELAAQLASDHDLRGRVRRLAKSFATHITPSKLDSSCCAKAWHSLDRRTAAYRPALTLVQMLFNTQGASLTNPTSFASAAGFLFDMNRFFQALLSRFLSENLTDCEVQDETVLRGVFAYDPANNPRHCPPPKLRPDFRVLRNHRVVAVLDAKYRDLWETSLPREMLYQLAVYALGQENIQRGATILYPTLNEIARQQVIHVKDPFRGSAKAQIVLRPVNLLKLEKLLNGKDNAAQYKRAVFANQLVFGVTKTTQLN